MHKNSTRCWFLTFLVSGKIRILKIIPIYIDVQCFPHGSVVRINLCEKCKRSNVRNVCHMLSSTSWWHEQTCLQTTRYQIYQYELKTDISEKCVSKLLTILQQILFLLWLDGRHYMELRLCVTVDSFCSQVRNIFPRISVHDHLCHRTMKKCLLQISLKLLSLSATQINVVKEGCWFPQINVFHKYSSTLVPDFVSFQPIFFFKKKSSAYTDKNSPFSRFTNKHSQFKTFPNRVPIELSRVAFPTIVLPEDDRTDFAQEEQLGLPSWTVTWAICASVDVSKNQDMLTLEFLNNVDASSFWPEYKLILRLLLVLPILVVLIWHPFVLQPSFVTQMNFARQSLNHLSQCHLGVGLDLCIFEIVVPTPYSWDERDPSFLFLTFSCHARIFSHFLHSFSTAAFASGIFMAWASEFPTFYEHFSLYAWIRHRWDQQRKYRVIFWHCLLFLFTFWCIRHMFPHFWPYIVRSWRRLFSC